MMKVLWTKNKVILYYVKNTWLETFKYCYKKIWPKKKPIFTFEWKIKMGFDVAICKFRMHLSWHTLRRQRYIHNNCLPFNYIWHHLLFNYTWHLSCLLCMFLLRKTPNFVLKKLKDLQSKKNHQFFKNN
jgi:hypothetical protein